MKLFNNECEICLETYNGGPPDIKIKFDGGKVVSLGKAKGNGTKPFPDGLMDKCIDEMKINGGSLDKEGIHNINNEEVYTYVQSLEKEIQREYQKV
ncbi:MAG TPA: hypothetical protein VIK14_08195 [Ignavibacteria bacterium]